MKRANGEGSIYRQKSGLWAAAVTIGRDAATGKLVRKYVYGKTKQEAQAKKAALLEQVKGGLAYIDADKVTVGEWLTKYLATYAKPRLRQNTYESYEYLTKKYLIPALGAIRLQKLQPNQIQTMLNAILAEKSNRLAAYAFAVLRTALRQALKEDLLLRDPTLAVVTPKKIKKEIKTLTPEEWETLFQAAKQIGYLYIAILLAWATGMRREEILGLRWQDIDFSVNTITISQTVIDTKNGPVISQPKSNSSYHKLLVPQAVIEQLRRYKAQQAADRLAAAEWQDYGLVVCRPNGQPYLPRYLTKQFGQLAKKASINARLHDLRHDHATRLFAAGCHAKDVQDRLGHSTVSITLDIYTHHVPQRENAIVNVLSANLPTNANQP